MATKITTLKGDVFRMHEEFIKQLAQCGIDPPKKMPDEVRRDINHAGNPDPSAAGARADFNGEVKFQTSSKIVVRKVKQTLVQVEEKSKKSKSAKLKKLFLSIIAKKPKEDKKKVIDVDEPSLVIEGLLTAKLGKESWQLLKFSCDRAEAEKMIAKGLAVEP